MGNLILSENNTLYDNQLTKALELAKSNSLEAQRLAMDCAKLISVSSDRLDELKNQSFFDRIIDKFTGRTQAMERASKEDFLKLQQMSFRYLEMINSNNMLMMDSIITIKNQLNYVMADNVETKKALKSLAEKIKNRFEALERRIERLETTTAIHGWLLTIEEFGYGDFPKYIRLLKIVDDFRKLKDKGWNMEDMRCLKSALKKTGISPNETVMIKDFVKEIAINSYTKPEYVDNINNMLLLGQVDANKVTNEISLPVLVTMYQFANRYSMDKDTLRRLLETSQDVKLDEKETISKIMIALIEETGIDVNAKVEHQHLAIELLTGVNMAKYFASKQGFSCLNSNCIIHKQNKHFVKPGFCHECGNTLELSN